MNDDGQPDGYAYLALDPGYTGACPCARFELDGTILDAHCWRTCSDCDRCGLHYVGDRAVAERVKVALDAMNWYGDWTLVEGARSR